MTGVVYWITGLSGAGKSTIAKILTKRLRAAGRTVLHFDGDVLRAILQRESMHSAADRQMLALSYARLCHEVARQGIDVVCATVSMFHSVRRWNRGNVLAYREIYLRVPMSELERRDSKGIYAGFRREEMSNVVGLDLPAELPDSADLVIDNYGEVSAGAAADVIWAKLVANALSPLGGLKR